MASYEYSVHVDGAGLGHVDHAAEATRIAREELAKRPLMPVGKRPGEPWIKGATPRATVSRRRRGVASCKSWRTYRSYELGSDGIVRRTDR